MTLRKYGPKTARSKGDRELTNYFEEPDDDIIKNSVESELCQTI